MNEDQDLINVEDPETGEIGSIPASQLQEAEGFGYKPVSMDQAREYVKQKEFGTTGQQALTFAEGAASAATFGLSTGLQTALGAEPENIEARREVNPVAYGAGQLTGLVGSTLVAPEVGVARLLGAGKALETAGAVGAKVLGAEFKAAEIFAREAAIANAAAQGVKVSPQLLKAAEQGVAAQFTTAQKLASIGLKESIEAGLFQSGDEISKMFTSQQSPAESAETALANIGLASALGGVGGVAIGSISPLYKAFKGQKQEAILKDILSGVDDDLAEGALREVSGPASILPDDYFLKRELADEFATQATNARQIQEAGIRLGVDLSPSTISGSNQARRTEAALSERATVAGFKTAKRFDKNIDIIDKTLESTLNDATELSKVEVGQKIAQDLAEQQKADFLPFKKRYESLSAELKKIELTPLDKGEISERILSQESALITKENENLARGIIENIEGRINNADQLRVYKSNLQKQLQGAYGSSPEKVGILKEAVKAVDDIQIRVSDNFPELKKLNAEYAAKKQKWNDLSVQTGLPKLDNEFEIEKLINGDSIAFEQLAAKVFRKDDYAANLFLKENFPKSFDLGRRWYKKELKNRAISTAQGERGKFNSGSFLRAVAEGKTSPEQFELLFPGDRQKILDARLIYENQPGIFNTSKTASAISFSKFLSPSGVLENVTDAAQYALLNVLPKLDKLEDDAEKLAALKMIGVFSGGDVDSSVFKAATLLIKNTIDGTQKLNNGIKSIFKAGKIELPSKMLPNDSDRKKLDDRVSEYRQDPEKIFDFNEKAGQVLPEQNASAAASASRAIEYLASIKPSGESKSPLGKDLPVSKAQKYQYDRALDIADKPLSILNDIKEGTINSRDVQTLKVIYPALYERMAFKMQDDMIDAVHDGVEIPYKTMLGMSLFLGTPLDSTMKPESIQAAQMSKGNVQSQQEQAPVNAVPQGGRRDYKGLAKVVGQDQTPSQARASSRSKV